MSTPDGRIVLSTSAPSSSPAWPTRRPRSCVRASPRERLKSPTSLSDRSRTSWCLSWKFPSSRSGNPACSISVKIPPSRFLALLRQKISNEEIVGLLDRNKRFIARIPDQDVRFGQLASEGWRRAIDRNPDGLVEVVSLEGDNNLTAYAQTANGWIVGIGLPTTSLEAPVRSLLLQAILAALALLALSAFLAFSIGRRISRGMSELTDVAVRVGRGEIVDAPTAPFVEAEAIGSALNHASVELKHRGELVARDNRALEALVEQRTAELRREMVAKLEVEERLRQSQKMEALGQLAGGVAHDFNNMLAIVIGSLDLARRRLEGHDTAAVAKFLESAFSGAQRAATLTARLLAFSRQQPLQPAVVNPNALVAGMSELLRRTLGEAIEVETVLAGGLWLTNADPTELESAVVNLAVNARDAMREGGKLTIETANCDLDERYAAAHSDVKAGQYVMISVTDNGAGMSEAVRRRAFEPLHHEGRRQGNWARAQPGLWLRQAILGSRQHLLGRGAGNEREGLSPPFCRRGAGGNSPGEDAWP